MNNSNQFKIANQANTSVETTPLSWGKSYLMCPPNYFGVFYEINPWMHQENRPDFELAIEQWHTLVAPPRRAAARVDTSETAEELSQRHGGANACLLHRQGHTWSNFRR